MIYAPGRLYVARKFIASPELGSVRATDVMGEWSGHVEEGKSRGAVAMDRADTTNGHTRVADPQEMA